MNGKNNQSKNNNTSKENNDNNIPKIKNSKYQSTEGIIKVILDKIISEVIYKIYSKITSDKLGNFCFEDIKEQMSHVLQTNFLNYTNDTKAKPDIILWATLPPSENTWVELTEPNSTEIDRYESSNVPFILMKDEQNNEELTLSPKVSTEKNYAFKNKKSNYLSTNKKNIISEVEEKSMLSGFTNKEIILEKDKLPEYSGIENKISPSISLTDAEINKHLANPKEESKTNKKEKENLIQTNNKDRKESNKKITKLPPIKQKGKQINIIESSYKDISGVENEYNHHDLEPPNVEFLRKEMEEYLEKKKLEEKVYEIQTKAKKVVVPTEVKLIDSNSLTFDSNGKIIQFHRYNIDNLIKDFQIAKNLIKKIEPKEKEKEKDKEKSLSYKMSKTKKEFKKIEKVIKNNPDDDFPLALQDNNKKGNDKLEKLNPSGSNFNIINPSMGVTIEESGMKKEGLKDYSKYFNKFSTKDYDKMLNEYIPLQNKSKIKSKSFAQNSQNLLSSNLSNLDYSENLINSETQINPLLQSNDQQSLYNMNNNINKDNNIPLNRINSGYNINNISNPLLSSNRNIESYKTLNTDNIIMKKYGSSSLKLELDTLKDLAVIKDNNVNIKNKRRNIFSMNYKTSQKPINNLLTEFNKKILINKQWGKFIHGKTLDEKDLNKALSGYNKHINRQQIMKELGNKILSGIKVRLPRERKIFINTNI